MLVPVRDSLSSVLEGVFDKPVVEPAEIIILARAHGAVEGLLAACEYLDEDSLLSMTTDQREAIDKAICLNMRSLAKQRVDVVSALV